MGTAAIIGLIGSILAVLSTAGGVTANKLQDKSNRENTNVMAGYNEDDTAKGVGIASDVTGYIGTAMSMLSSFGNFAGSTKLMNQATNFKNSMEGINKITRNANLIKNASSFKL